MFVCLFLLGHRKSLLSFDCPVLFAVVPKDSSCGEIKRICVCLRLGARGK